MDTCVSLRPVVDMYTPVRWRMCIFPRKMNNPCSTPRDQAAALARIMLENRGFFDAPQPRHLVITWSLLLQIVVEKQGPVWACSRLWRCHTVRWLRVLPAMDNSGTCTHVIQRVRYKNRLVAISGESDLEAANRVHAPGCAVRREAQRRTLVGARTPPL